MSKKNPLKTKWKENNPGYKQNQKTWLRVVIYRALGFV